MECPRCGGALDAVPVASCGTCRGAFVTHSALDEALAERAQTVLPATPVASVEATDVRYLRCPECSQPMARSLFGKRSGVVVDVCAAHGTWFDPSELERAAHHAFAHGRAPGPRVAPPRPPPSEAEVEGAKLQVALLNARYEHPRRDRQGALLDIVLDWLDLR